VRSMELVHDVMAKALPGVRYWYCDCCETAEVMVSEEQTEEVRDDDLGGIVVTKSVVWARENIYQCE